MSSCRSFAILFISGILWLHLHKKSLFLNCFCSCQTITSDYCTIKMSRVHISAILEQIPLNQKFVQNYYVY